MSIKLIVTKTCSHCKDLRRELEDLGVEYDLCYVEDNPDLVSKHNIRHSPNIMLDDEIVCRGLVPEGQLRELLRL